MMLEKLKSADMKEEYKVIFSTSDIEEQIVQAVSKKAKTFKMQGFRPGHVPLDIVRSNVEHHVLGDVFESLISNACDKVLKELGDVEIISKPSYKFLTKYEKGQDVEVSIEVELAPKFELLPYEIKIEKFVPVVSDDELKNRIDIMMKEHPCYEKAEADYVINKLDQVMYKAECYINNVLSKKKSFEDQIIIPAEFSDDAEFIKGFIGKKVGESFDFTPASEKNRSYKITVRSIKKALKDIAVADYAVKSGFKDEMNFRTFVESVIKNEAAQLSFLYHKNQILEDLASKYSFELPKSVIDQEMKNVIASAKRDLESEKAKGTAKDEDLNKTDADLEKEYADVVNKRVLLGYVLNKIAKKEKISVSDTELHNAVLQEVQSNPMYSKQIVEYYSKNPGALAYKKAEIIERKVIDLLVSKADAIEVEKHKDEIKVIVDKILED